MVDPQLLQAALAKALTESVTPEVSKKLLEEAMLAYLFTSRREPYSNKEATPLSDAFQKALDAATKTIAAEVLALPENKAKLVAAMQSGFDVAIKDTVVTEKLAEKMISVFQRF